MNSGASDPSLPARLREFHADLPLAGGRPNAVFALAGGRILSRAAVLRDTPRAASRPSRSKPGRFPDVAIGPSRGRAFGAST
ncbi:MAG: hypothetical protein ABFC38_08285 [Methanospirillum sp.]